MPKTKSPCLPESTLLIKMKKEKIKEKLNEMELKDLVELRNHINKIIEYQLIGLGILKI